ncbi:MAG TPA: hypothetical protein VMT68_12065 [Caulobacteraceae bacterium]|nr:hypothetical protein [Caulobacteraceae bacterium]
MRFYMPLIAAGAFLVAGQALAAGQTTAGMSNMPATDAPMQSTTPAAPPSSSASPPSTSSATGQGADTSATAGAAASLSVGEPVKDNTGATIGAISALNNGANGQKMAVIKMGSDTFQVPSDRLGAQDGTATINMTAGQITSMLHPAAGGR